MTKIIGFATEFYTLWDYTTEQLYTTDAYGNHHLSGTKHNYYYQQNISKDLDTVKAKHPGVSIDDSLRGKCRSFDRMEKIELPAEFFSFGKYTGRTVADVLAIDFKYLLWYKENVSNKTAELIKTLPEITAHFEKLAQEEKDRKGTPVLLSSGKQELTIHSNGRSDFHYFNGMETEDLAQYTGRPYMIAVLENDKGFETVVHIILNDVKEVNGRYPYLMPIINGKAMKTKNKTLSLDLNIIYTSDQGYNAYQIALINN